MRLKFYALPSAFALTWALMVFTAGAEPGQGMQPGGQRPDGLAARSVSGAFEPPPLDNFSIPPQTSGPGAAEAGLKDAARRFKSGQYRAAVQMAEGVMRAYRGTAWEGRAAFLAGRAYGELKEFDAASSSFAEARARIPALSDYSLYLLADYYYGSGRGKDAEPLYGRLLSDYPDSPLAADASLNLGRIYCELGRCQEAVKVLRALLDRKNGPAASAKGMLLLAEAYEKTGERDMAAVACRRLRLEYPWTTQATKAASLVREWGLSTAPWSVEERTRIGDGLYEHGLYEMAAGYYEGALESARAPETLGRLYMKAGLSRYRLKHNKKAEEHFRKALDIGPAIKEAPEALYRLARTYLREGDEDGYRDAALRCAAGYPGSPRAVDSLYMLGTTFSQNGDYDTAVELFGWLLADNPGSGRSDEVYWQIGWAHFQAGDYASSERAFSQLASYFPNSSLAPQGLYWRARSLALMGDKASADDAMGELQRLYDWSFYGLLAQDGGAHVMAPAAKAPATEERPPVKEGYKDARLARAHELALQGMGAEAGTELRRAEKAYAGNIEGVRTLAGLYGAIGDYSRPMALASELYGMALSSGAAGIPDAALRLIYPLAYWKTVKREAEVFGLDPFLISAVMREESHCDPDAVSPAGAVGLMQLMPGTARLVCRKLSVSYTTAKQLQEVEFNVPLGACYLEGLTDKHKGRLVPALAEYNAGPEQLSRWLKKRPDAPDDVFIEGIDYYETRNYIKRVLRNYYTYRRLYGQ